MTNAKKIKPENNAPVGRPRGDASALPIFDSMAQCEAATGIPMNVLKQAKSAGCDAFTHGRIHLDRLLRWLFARGDDQDNIDWGDEFKKWKAKREKMAHDRDAKQTADKGEVMASDAKIIATLFGALERMRHEGPPAWKGMGEIEIYEKFGKQIDGLKDELTVAFERLEKGENETSGQS